MSTFLQALLAVDANVAQKLKVMLKASSFFDGCTLNPILSNAEPTKLWRQLRQVASEMDNPWWIPPPMYRNITYKEYFIGPLSKIEIPSFLSDELFHYDSLCKVAIFMERNQFIDPRNTSIAVRKRDFDMHVLVGPIMDINGNEGSPVAPILEGDNC